MSISSDFRLSSDISQALDRIESDIHSGNIYKVLEAVKLIELVQDQVYKIIMNQVEKSTFLERIQIINIEIGNILHTTRDAITSRIKLLEEKNTQPFFSRTGEILPKRIILSPIINSDLGESIKQFFIAHPGTVYSLETIQERFGNSGMTKDEVRTAFLLAKAELNRNGKIQLHTQEGGYCFVTKEKGGKRKAPINHRNQKKNIKPKTVKATKSPEIVLGEIEKIDTILGDFHIKTLSAQSVGNNKKEYSVQVGEQTIYLSLGEYRIFRKLIMATELSLQLVSNEYTYYNHIIQKLKDLGYPELINILEQKRNKRVKKEKEVREKVIRAKAPKNTEVALTEAEKIKMQLGNFNIETTKSQGKGKKQIFFVQINEEELSFTPSQYHLFKILCEAQESIELEKDAIGTLRLLKNFLTQEGFGELAEILGGKRKLKEKKEKNKSTSLLLSESEKCDIVFKGYVIKTLSVSYIEKNKKEFVVQIGEDTIFLSQGEYNLFRNFLSSENENIRLKSEQYQYYASIVEKFVVIKAEELKFFFEQKRIKRVKKEKVVRVKIVGVKAPKNTEITLTEAEKIKIQMGDFNIETTKSQGKGKKQIFFVQINEEELSFTPSQYHLFKFLCETKEKIDLEKNRIPILRGIKKLLIEAEFGKLVDLLGGKRKTNEKTVKVNTQKDSNIPLDEREKIDSHVGMFLIKTLSAKSVGNNKKEYSVQIGENTVSFTQAEYRLFSLYLITPESSIEFSFPKQSIYYKNIRATLGSIGASELINFFEKKMKRRVKKEKVVRGKTLKNTPVLLSETEKIDIQVGEYFLRTQKAVGNGIKRKFHIQVGEKVIVLTPLQNAFLKTLCFTETKIKIEKEQFYVFHSLMETLKAAELGELVKILSEKRKKEEKIEIPKEISQTPNPRNIPQAPHISGARVFLPKAPLTADKLSSSNAAQIASKASPEIKSHIEIDETFIGVLKNFLLENPGINYSFMQLYEKFNPDLGKSFEQVKTTLLLLKAQEERRGNTSFKMLNGMIGYFPQSVQEEKVKKSPSAGTSRKQKTEKNEKEKALLHELHPSEVIDTYILGSPYKSLGKTMHGSVTRYTLSVGESEIILRDSEFKVLLFLVQKKGKICKIASKHLPALRSLSGKLPKNHIRNERGEGYYIGEYAPELRYSGARKAAHIEHPINKEDYAFDSDVGCQSAIIQLFQDYPGRFFTFTEIEEILGPKDSDTHNIKTQFLLAKSRYNNPIIKIVEGKNGWVHIPEVIDAPLIKMGDIDVYFLPEYGVLLTSDKKIIFQTPNIEEFIKKKGTRLMHKKLTPGSYLNPRESFIGAIGKIFPHLFVEKDGTITTGREKSELAKANLRIANEQRKKLLPPPTE